MSRFTGSRKTAIAVWTGATVAWASTLAAVLFEPPTPSVAEARDNTVTVTTNSSESAFPSQPESGLLVIRRDRPAEPSVTRTVRTVIVPAPSPQPATRPAPAPPQPSSSGS